MRLSEIKGERVFDVIGEIVVPIANIAEDSGVQTAIGSCKGKKPLDAAKSVVPIIIRKHKADLVAVLAAVNGVTTEEYERELTMAKLFGDVYEILTDEELLSFFG